MPLSELRKPENIAVIKPRYAECTERLKRERGNCKLIEPLADPDEDDAPKGCLICQL